jgi:hypothetical protein
MKIKNYSVPLVAFFLFPFLVLDAQDYVQFASNGKIGFKNKNGTIVIPANFDRAGNEFSKGFVNVLKNEKWGYIDSTGKVVIPYIYQEADTFLPNGIAKVLGGRNHIFYEGYIDMSGKIIIPLIYNMIEFNQSGKPLNVFAVSLNEKEGILDIRGKIKLPVIYDELEYFKIAEGGFYIVKKNGKFGTVDENNKTIISFGFDVIQNDWLNKRLKLKINNKDEGYFVDYTGKLL